MIDRHRHVYPNPDHYPLMTRRPALVQIMAHPLAYSAPSNSAAMARCRRFMSRFEPFSPYHGKSVECSLIFLADNTCISEPCIMLQTMPHQILLSSPSNSARMTRYRWLGVPIHMYTDHTHTHTHTNTHTWFMNTHDTIDRLGKI